MNLSDVNPHIRYASRHEKLNKAEQDSICYDCRLFFVQKGAGQICIFGEKYNFSNNTLIFLPPETQYRFYQNPEEAISIYILNFDLVSDYSYLEKSLTTATVTSFEEGRAPRYELAAEFSSAALYTFPEAYEPLKRITDEFLTLQPCYREISSGVLKSLLMQLVRARSSRADGVSGICGSVREYIHENFHLCDLSNEDIARHFGYHPYYLSHVFLNDSGKSIRAYLTDYRLRMAKNYLVTTDLDISVISWKCGFNSPAYFSKLFGDAAGMTPRQYRRIHTGVI